MPQCFCGVEERGADDPTYKSGEGEGPLRDYAKPAPKPFGKAVAEAYRGIKERFNDHPRKDADPQVREEVNADLDKLIEKNENR